MAMTQLDSDGDGSFRPLAEINVTPMVDVMLVLLIIFMVAAPLMMVGVPVQLPKASAAKVNQPREPVVVSVTRDGGVFVREVAVPEEDLVRHLTELHGADPEAVVYVRGDRQISYGRVMEIMGRVGQAGFAKVSLLAESAAPPDTAAAR